MSKCPTCGQNWTGPGSPVVPEPKRTMGLEWPALSPNSTSGPILFAHPPTGKKVLIGHIQGTPIWGYESMDGKPPDKEQPDG